jgi:hypothetical protein
MKISCQRNESNVDGKHITDEVEKNLGKCGDVIILRINDEQISIILGEKIIYYNKKNNVTQNCI